MMGDWEPLSVRRGKRHRPEPHEGIPDHLTYPIRHWLEGRFGYRKKGGMDRGLMMYVATATGIALTPTHADHQLQDQIIGAGERDHDLYLDVLDAVLHWTEGAGATTLRELLETGGSTWTVAEDGQSLERRVDPTAARAIATATNPADEASKELREAWANVYGRNPDPSDAWDHAIKAVEALMIPIVVPRKTKATLGDVLGELGNHPGTFMFSLDTSSKAVGSVETLEALLRLMWPNPDRHAGAGPTKTPSLPEAEAVVQIAVLTVQWLRSGVLVRK